MADYLGTIAGLVYLDIGIGLLFAV